MLPAHRYFVVRTKSTNQPPASSAAFKKHFLEVLKKLPSAQEPVGTIRFKVISHSKRTGQPGIKHATRHDLTRRHVLLGVPGRLDKKIEGFSGLVSFWKPYAGNKKDYVISVYMLSARFFKFDAWILDLVRELIEAAGYAIVKEEDKFEEAMSGPKLRVI